MMTLMLLKTNQIKGSTPLGVYKRLVKFYQGGQLSFKYVKTFNMDEYVGKFFLTIRIVYHYNLY